jgi:hypothetical protein
MILRYDAVDRGTLDEQSVNISSDGRMGSEEDRRWD